MWENLKLLPNQLTLVRFALIPLLWLGALAERPFYLGLGLVVAFVSDALDGPLARRLRQVTEFGSKFDSLADNLLVPSAVLWLLMLHPQIVREQPLPSALAVVLYMASLTLGWVKFRRFANLHLYSSKAAGLVEYAFIIHTLLTGDYHRGLFYAAVTMFILSSTETLVLQLTRPQVDEHIGTIARILLAGGTLQRERSER